MKKMNVIAVLDKEKENVLMCERAKEPYKGMYNFVGGKIEDNNPIKEAYRELLEETGIKENDIVLKHLITMTYITLDKELEVYYGILNKDVTLIEEINKLKWIPLKNNFFDLKKYAGEGAVGHIIEQIKIDVNKQ